MAAAGSEAAYLPVQPAVVPEPQLDGDSLAQPRRPDEADGDGVLHAVVEQHLGELAVGDELGDQRAVPLALEPRLDARADLDVPRVARAGRGRLAERGGLADRRPPRRRRQHHAGHDPQPNVQLANNNWLLVARLSGRLRVESAARSPQATVPPTLELEGDA